VDLSDAIQDHSISSKNLRGRFRDNDVLRHVFETMVAQSIEAGLANGQRYSAGASIIAADVNCQKSTP
jgi:transposase